MKSIGIGALAIVASWLLACSDDGSSGGPSGGSGGTTGGADCSEISSKTFDALSSADVAMLCDCVAALYGGYGTSVVCGDGALTLKAKASQEECVSSFKPVTCTTVGEAIACASDFKACNLSTPACTEYTKCVLGDAG